MCLFSINVHMICMTPFFESIKQLKLSPSCPYNVTQYMSRVYFQRRGTRLLTWKSIKEACMTHSRSWGSLVSFDALLRIAIFKLKCVHLKIIVLCSNFRSWTRRIYRGLIFLKHFLFLCVFSSFFFLICFLKFGITFIR